MAFTNAQLQARHRGRVKARLDMAALMERFQQTVRDQITEAGGDPDCPSTVNSHIGKLMRTPEGAMMLMPFLAQAMGIPVTANPAGTPRNHQ